MTHPSKRALLVFSFLALAAAYGLAQEVHLDVPFVPTRYPVVDEMLRMAKVTKHDIVYDLGCGDGRILVTAAQRFGARGVGYDIDPERIKECHENAEKAGVTDKVKFILGDLFQADFHEATVMPMYLLPSVNLKLRPKIFRELKPGSRVVSHDFSMENWTPDAHTTVEDDEMTHEVYLWIVPANVSGSWTWTTGEGGDALRFAMEVTQLYQVAEAKVTVNGSSAAVKDMKIDGENVDFAVDGKAAGKSVSFTFAGKASKDRISGTIKGQIDGRNVSFPWKAARKPGTEKRIDEEPTTYY